MDPLLLEALRFGVAILAGGIVAVIAQPVAFRHAQTLAATDRFERRCAALRALLAEVEENLERIGGQDRNRAPTMVERSAWDQARELSLPSAALESLRRAYAAAAELNSRIAIVAGTFRRLSRRTLAPTPSDESTSTRRASRRPRRARLTWRGKRSSPRARRSVRSHRCRG
jgi:hypothetical protein